ncbi:MAG TPA: hypothetical protein PKY82_05700 [Pyrinomonadaceae bacterium]|nr:hypothetical protein [Pyrinomonadaceae bacterium]
MSTLAEKLKKTQNSFPAQAPSSVVSCPHSGNNQPQNLVSNPVEVETAFQITQQVSAPQMVASQAQEKPKDKKAWIEIILVDAEGKPMPNVKYRITPPSGAPVEGRLNEHGQAGLYQIEPGNCKITFPDLDKDAWE